MNLLKSAGFLLKSLYLRPFHSVNIRGDLLHLLKSSRFFSCFALSFGKNIGIREIFTNIL